MSACTILKDLILNHMTSQTVWSPSATWYVSLHTADPGAGGEENELTGNGYARKSVLANDTQWTAPSGGIIENINNLAYPAATADWPEVTHFCIHKQSTGANGLVKQALVAPITILSGGVFQFAPGKLRVKVL